MAGIVAGQDNVQAEILAQVEDSIGADGAEAIEELLTTAFDPETGRITTIIAIILTLLAASNVFSQLQTALDKIWHVRPREDLGIKGILRTRLISLSMALSIGFLLMVSLVISGLIVSLNVLIVDIAPGVQEIAQIINLILSFVTITILFGMIFRVLPHITMRWKDVAVGASFTAALFLIGQWGISQYIAQTGATSAYGAAGSLIAILLWIYYSAQILFFGAEFTQVWANEYGIEILPSKDAVRVLHKYRTQQEINTDSEQAKQADTKDRVVSLHPAPETILTEYPATLPRSPEEPAPPNNPLAVSWFSGFISGLGTIIGGVLIGSLFLLRRK